MYNCKDDIPPEFWPVIFKQEIQEESQLPLQLYSEEFLEYILEKLYEIEQKCADLDVTRD